MKIGEEQLFVVIRHGIGSDSALSDGGRATIRRTGDVIDALTKKALGAKKVARILFSFSFFGRAVKSAQELSRDNEDVVITDLYLTERSEIDEPQRILKKVLKIADCYGAQVIVVVAHGEMPAVLSETANEFVIGEKLPEKLPSPSEACGYIVSMKTGEVTSIGPDSLDEKPKDPVVQEIEVPGSVPKRIFTGDDNLEDDIVPF
ncbi:MAG: hypothetical protein Q8O94_00730 [bacterium]|nr:hypothetical protein [bacterium]